MSPRHHPFDGALEDGDRRPRLPLAAPGVKPAGHEFRGFRAQGEQVGVEVGVHPPGVEVVGELAGDAVDAGVELGGGQFLNSTARTAASFASNNLRSATVASAFCGPSAI